MTEWEFTADVASWINLLLEKDPSLPFSEAKCEQRGEGSLKRRDLTLLDKNRRVVLTGEVKLPYQKDGGSPYNSAVVKDARNKAKASGASHFFTWNVNQCVLWETEPAHEEWPLQDYHRWDITSVHRAGQMEQPMTQHAIQKWLPELLHEFARILRGTTPIGHRPPDEKFTEALESSLELPVRLTADELHARYVKPAFKAELNKWMRDDQGWVIYDDPQGIQDNLERAAKYACYATVNRLVFYEALLKRYGASLQKIQVPDHIDTGEALRHHLEGYFAEARQATGDYETVFGEDHTNLGNRIPFYADAAVPHWRELINQIHEFDFSKLDYEIIGNIFERLISPEERHKYGQFYTRAEVVDLILSFCIRDGTETVMDPACGGGTFLVRAYARKRELAPQRKHGERLSELYGADISPFAAHLTTINLATRDLIDDENYPQVARSDFFNLKPHQTFIRLPRHIAMKGLGASQHRNVEIPQLDAMVGNPPYVRQEDLPKARNKKVPEPGTKDFYQRIAKQQRAELSGRSDIHCYFWPHAASFLKPEGMLCLLTSSQWLDVEYGFRLQAWMLQQFEIVAVFESLDEPWFVGARVATAVTILRRQPDEAKRMANTTRFVQLRRPVRELLVHDGTTAGAVSAADHLRDEILGLTQNTTNIRYRARLVNQGELWREGVKLASMMGKSGGGDEEEHDNDATIAHGTYYGGKWGVHLRAPDLWFDLLDRYGSRFAPLGDLAEIRRGITSGKDSFFFPRDTSAECLQQTPDPEEFHKHWGVPRSEVENGAVKLVSCGEGRGEIRPIEACYLEPEVHSLMEIERYFAASTDCANFVLLVGKRKAALANTHALRYIEWGESQGFHVNPTSSSRATEEQEWYDLTRLKRPDIILPKIQQYRLMSFLNPEKLYQNSSLLGIYDAPAYLVKPLCAVLNSTVSILSRLVYARMLGNEGNIQLDVYSAKMMLVPNIIKCKNSSISKRLSTAFDKMLQRDVLAFVPERRLREMAYTKAGKEDQLAALTDLSELDMPDRRELDDAVLELLGIGDRKERDRLLDELYGYLREFFEWTRQKEEKAIGNKNKAKRKTAASPAEIATQILDGITQNEAKWLRRYDPDFLDRTQPFDTFDLPQEGEAQATQDMLAESGGVLFAKGKKQIAFISTRNPAQPELMVLLAEHGIRGLTRLPHKEAECRALLTRFEDYLRQRRTRLAELVEDRTGDPDLQEKVLAILTQQMAAR